MSLQETFYAFGIATMVLLIINYLISAYIGYKFSQLIGLIITRIRRFKMPRIPTPRIESKFGTLSLV